MYVMFEEVLTLRKIKLALGGQGEQMFVRLACELRYL